jgi:hypothetical protein
LQALAPVSKGCIRAAELTDPDTRAVVVTREDRLLIVDYLDGSRLLQVMSTWRVQVLWQWRHR